MSDSPDNVREIVGHLRVVADNLEDEMELLLPLFSDANIRSLRKAADLLERSAGEWVPVTERSPEGDRERHLVLNSNGVREAFLIQSEKTWYADCEVMGRERLLPLPTHWLDVRLPTSSGEAG